MSAFSLAEYHAAERNAGVALALLGVASAASAAWVVRARSPLAAMAWPLALGALVELGVGAGMAWDAHRALAQELTADAETMATISAKLAVLAKNHRIATRVELGMIAMSAVLSLALPRPGAARAILLGVLVEAVALLCFDTFGLSRATQHLDQLTGSGAMARHPPES
jgi:hypothetical protein